MSDSITLPDVDVDLDAVLEPRSDDQERHHDFYLSESDMRILCRALRGDAPADDAARKDRRALLVGLVYQLTGEQPVGA
jgi:hypothetical protein